MTDTTNPASQPAPALSDMQDTEQEYAPGQWWLVELENLWGRHGEVTLDTRRAAKVACDFAASVFAAQGTPAGEEIECLRESLELANEHLRQALGTIATLKAERAPSGESLLNLVLAYGAACTCMDDRAIDIMEAIKAQIARRAGTTAAPEDFDAWMHSRLFANPPQSVTPYDAFVAGRATAGTTAAPAKHSPDCENAGCTGCIDPHELARQLAGNAAPDYPALRLFLNAAYPVASQINPRGYNWCEAYLDQARAAAIAEIAGNAATAAPGDLSTLLREYAGNSGYSHNDYADTMRQAADELDRLASNAGTAVPRDLNAPEFWKLCRKYSTAPEGEQRRAAEKAVLDFIASNAGAAPAWRPIETAPRDGTVILLGRAADEGEGRDGESAPGRWHEGYGDAPDDMGHDDGFMDLEFNGTFSCGRSFGNPTYQSKGYQPTHWMPLPAAPSDNSPVGGKGPRA